MGGEGAPDLGHSRELIALGRAQAALSALEPFEFQFAGDPGYDYLLGLAALESGAPGRATLALERALAVNPGDVAARFAMARAYLALGERAQAGAALQELLDLNPPPPDRAVILNELRGTGSGALGLRLTGYAELGIGRDTNVNTSTSESSISVPALVDTVFRLAPLNIATADDYLAAGAGAALEYPLGGALRLYASADARGRLDASATEFNTSSIDARLGLLRTTERDQVRAGLLAAQFGLAGSANRNSLGATLEWRHALNADTERSVFGQMTVNRFPDRTLRPNDFDQAYVGVGLHRLLGGARALVYGSLYAGGEAAPHGRADGARALGGFRSGVVARLGDEVEGFVHLGLQWGGYSQNNAAFLTRRNDALTDVSLGLNLALGDRWTLRPQLLWVNSMSNIVIDGYERWDLSLTLRREFR